VSRGKDFGVFFKANALEKFWSHNEALERNFGRLFFFLFLCVFLRPRISSAAACFVLISCGEREKKRASEDARKTEEA
jgi:hypothetical protein